LEPEQVDEVLLKPNQDSVHVEPGRIQLGLREVKGGRHHEEVG